MELEGTDGDVWAWSTRVTGTFDPARCRRVTVASPRAVVPVRSHGARFAAAVPLTEGRNAVVARCHTRAGGVLASDALDWNVRLGDVPRARLRVVIVDEGISLDGGATARSPASQSPIVDWAWIPSPANPAPLELAEDGAEIEAAGARRIVVRAPPVDGEYYVNLVVRDAGGRTDETTTYFEVENGEARVVDMEHEHPAWVDEAIVYGVVPFLFGERPLEGVRGRLDALDRLGVDTLWLSPIFEAPDDDFGYAVTDYFGVRGAYGTAEDLRALVDGAHARGMRVILDLVPNHTSDEHPYYVQAQREGPGSRYWSFYDREPDGDPTHYFDWENLPNLDYDNPEVRRWVLASAAYWIEEFDIDGYRVDVAWGVRLRAPEFWPEFRRELKRIKPDILLLAEATARDEYWFEEGYDAAYDWTWELGKWAWAEVFEGEGQGVDIAALNGALTNAGEGFPEDALVFRFIDNNDTGPRFRTRHSPGLERAASLLLFTVPGLPSLYTGADVGAEYEPYQRQSPLAWAAAEPVPYHARHIALRRAHPALRADDFLPVPVAADEPVYAFLRADPETGERLLVVINFGARPTVARIDPPSELTLPEAAVDVLHEERVVLGTGVLRLPAHNGRVLAVTPARGRAVSAEP